MQFDAREISPVISEKAPLILAEIKKARSILLHCHPSPDPDSVGSALAMKFALEQLGKKATVIKGDSEIPQAFMHFPGAGEIVKKNFFEVNLKEFDLFISLDTAALDRISSLGELQFPTSMKVIDIDHHRTNPGFGSINLIEASYPATCQILFDLFKEWDIEITPDIASDLFIGIYTDTGGFKYRETTVRTFTVAAELVKIAPDFPQLISRMDNSNSPEFLSFLGLAFDSIETFLDGQMAISSISSAALSRKKIPESDASASVVSSRLITVSGWIVGVTLLEVEHGETKASLRSSDPDKFDVSKLAVALGGGGHKSAAGATLKMSLPDAKALVVAKAKELYNL